MPILHIQFRAVDPESGDRRPISVPAGAALYNRGPCLQVSVALLQPMAQAMLQEGREVPAPVSGMALVDTGASHTCIDEHAAQELGLPVVDTVSIASASQPSALRSVYPVTIEIAGLPLPVNAPRAVGAELAPQGLLALIGRDVLQSCTLFYNGPTDQITLSV
jgi:predicted aspartyl protease